MYHRQLESILRKLRCLAYRHGVVGALAGTDALEHKTNGNGTVHLTTGNDLLVPPNDVFGVIGFRTGVGQELPSGVSERASLSLLCMP